VLLVLWDLDHTLLEVRNISRAAYVAGFERETGRRFEKLPAMAGRTDRAIIEEILQLHDLAISADLVERVGKAIGDEYTARSELVRGNGGVLPGAFAVLQELDRITGVHQSVLTGNMRPIAHTKVVSLGLADPLDLEVGAFGMDGSVRSDLVRLALRRAGAKLGEQLTPKDAVLIGDTPLDVVAAHHSGARGIAVATGRSSVADLRAAGADIVFNDLTDTPAVVQAVLGPR
jgi:phosphoglycolate phosphatase-like HAD superfamily hydrolase